MERADHVGNENTLILVADAGVARLFIRRRPGAVLEELPFSLPTVVYGATASPARTCGDQEILCGTPVHALLLAAAASVGQAARQSCASQLVICAPPHALCAIRDGLDSATRRLLACELTRNVAHEPVSAIDAWLEGHQI